MTRESWLAGSSWSLRSMFGTAASLAGIQNSVNASIRNCATNSQIRLSTSGIDANSPNRMMSTTTIVLRRSNRSAKAPASGPEDDRRQQAEEQHAAEREVRAANPSTSDVAVAVIASRPEPVAEARQRHRQPQPPEIADPQDRPQLGDQPDGTEARRRSAAARRRAAAPVASGRTDRDSRGSEDGLRVPRRPHGTGRIRRLPAVSPADDRFGSAGAATRFRAGEQPQARPDRPAGIPPSTSATRASGPAPSSTCSAACTPRRPPPWSTSAAARGR